MLKRIALPLAAIFLAAFTSSAQTKLSPKWEELTAADFEVNAFERLEARLVRLGEIFHLQNRARERS